MYYYLKVCINVLIQLFLIIQLYMIKLLKVQG